MVKEEKTGAKAVIIVLIAVFILIIAGAVYIQKVKLSKVLFEYNGFQVKREVDKSGNLYSIQLYLNENSEPSTISVRNDPRNLEDIPVEYGLREKVLKSEAFVTMEPNASGLTVVAAIEISKIIGNEFLYAVPTKGALLWDVGTGAPVKDCKDADDDTAIIKLVKGNQTAVYSENECVIVEGKTQSEIIESADRLILTLLGIMKE